MTISDSPPDTALRRHSSQTMSGRLPAKALDQSVWKIIPVFVFEPRASSSDLPVSVTK
jgi:hypothetical protein